MFQEKTNLETAFMFQKLIEALKSGENIFQIVNILNWNILFYEEKKISPKKRSGSIVR